MVKLNKEKKEVGVRPYFFKFLEGGKDYKFKKFHTGMDYLEIVLDDNVKNNYNKKIKELEERLSSTEDLLNRLAKATLKIVEGDK